MGARLRAGPQRGLYLARTRSATPGESGLMDAGLERPEAARGPTDPSLPPPPGRLGGSQAQRGACIAGQDSATIYLRPESRVREEQKWGTPCERTLASTANPTPPFHPWETQPPPSLCRPRLARGPGVARLHRHSLGHPSLLRLCVTLRISWKHKVESPVPLVDLLPPPLCPKERPPEWMQNTRGVLGAGPWGSLEGTGFTK